MMGYALTYCTYALQNYDIPTNYTARTQVKDLTITADPQGYISDRAADARNLILANKQQIAVTVDRMRLSIQHSAFQLVELTVRMTL